MPYRNPWRLLNLSHGHTFDRPLHAEYRTSHVSVQDNRDGRMDASPCMALLRHVEVGHTEYPSAISATLAWYLLGFGFPH